MEQMGDSMKDEEEVMGAVRSAIETGSVCRTKATAAPEVH